MSYEIFSFTFAKTFIVRQNIITLPDDLLAA